MHHAGKQEEPLEVSKDLVAASAAPLVLSILMRGESYGYAIVARVRELSGGRLEWKEGMLYPLLHRLEKNGFVVATTKTSKDGRDRRYYRITTQGKRALAEQRERWSFMNDILSTAWEGIHV